ncbi:MAG: hypothetical protein ASARMPRED_005271 [Alectoria sarmentosa]|nr:MAG: hypothetical protein ASARMPRED_005271 [Alectoria sarmentosa]
MAKRKAREEDAKGSRDQEDHDPKATTADKDNDSQTLPMLHATRKRQKKGAKGDSSEDEGNGPLQDNTSEGQRQNTSQIPQVCTNKSQHLSSGASEDHRLVLVVNFTDCEVQIRQTPDAGSGKTRKTRVRKSGKTKYCGIVSKRIKTPNKAARTKGDFFCIICGSRFTRAESVNYHFPRCVEEHGNPHGNHWNDHPSCAHQGTHEGDVATGSANSAPYVDQENDEQEEEDDGPIQYNTRTIASDILQVLGEHPMLPPLNAHTEGRDLVSEPLAGFSPRIRSREPPTESTYPTQRHSVCEDQGNNAAEEVGAEQGAAPAEWRNRREKEDAEKEARIKAEEEFSSVKSTGSNLSPLSQNPSGNSASNQTHPSSQLGPLPSGWEMRYSDRGFIADYFVNHRTGIMTVDDPRFYTEPEAFERLGDLPSGWDMRMVMAASGPRMLYVDHNNRTNTWTDPRTHPS